MKRIVYITFFFAAMLVGCEKSELERPQGEPKSKHLPIDMNAIDSSDLDRNPDVQMRSGGRDINDDGDDETGSKPGKKD